MHQSDVRLGVDLGGTKIEIAALDRDGGVSLRRRAPTPQGDYDGTIRTIVDLIRDAQRELQQQPPIGIGTPGALSPASCTIRNANSTVLNGRPLKTDLEASLGRPIRMTNDANCFTLSEARDGAARDGAVVFGVILGTGVGGGIAVKGRILDGCNAIAGEWGHLPLPWPQTNEFPGPRCYCGKLGCVETFVSGPALSREFGPPLYRATEIESLAQAGDEHPQVVFATYLDRLARSLAVVLNVLDPDVVVFGGGVSNLQTLYQDLPALVERYVFSDVLRTIFVRAQHGDSSGVRGAAMLWP